MYELSTNTQEKKHYANIGKYFVNINYSQVVIIIVNTNEFLDKSIWSLKIFEYIKIGNWKTQIPAFKIYKIVERWYIKW